MSEVQGVGLWPKPVSLAIYVHWELLAGARVRSSVVEVVVGPPTYQRVYLLRSAANTITW